MTHQNEKREQQMQIQYALIGEFVVAFELLCNMMRAMIGIRCSVNAANQANISALTIELTAFPPLKAYQAVMVTHPKQDAFSKSLFDKLYNQIRDLIEKRNTIVHGTTYIGWGNESTTDWSNGHTVRSTLSKQGVSTSVQATNEAAIQPLIQECRTLYDLVLGLSGTLFSQHMDFAKNYKIENGRVVRIEIP